MPSKEQASEESLALGAMTFRQLEEKYRLAHAGHPEWSLECWYSGLLDTPLREFQLDDLARAIRQRVFPQELIGMAIPILERQPLAGSLNDGELVVAMRCVPSGYWDLHADQRCAVRSIAERAKVGADGDIADEIGSLLQGLG